MLASDYRYKKYIKSDGKIWRDRRAGIVVITTKFEKITCYAGYIFYEHSTKTKPIIKIIKPTQLDRDLSLAFKIVTLTCNHAHSILSEHALDIEHARAYFSYHKRNHRQKSFDK